jgi:(p)ppGpp synthase/HD superfamily hydrolase
MSVQRFSKMQDVIAIAEFAHRNQTDRAGLPYIEHPKRVMESVRAQGALPYVQMAAVLHDVTEDTAFTPEMLIELGVPEAAVEIVKLVDRDHSKAIYYNVGKDQSGPEDTWPEYAQFIAHHSIDEFYYEEIRKNPAARMVKLADINDNLQPWRLSYLKPETQERLRAKYAKAHELLGV